MRFCGAAIATQPGVGSGRRLEKAVKRLFGSRTLN